MSPRWRLPGELRWRFHFIWPIIETDARPCLGLARRYGMRWVKQHGPPRLPFGWTAIRDEATASFRVMPLWVYWAWRIGHTIAPRTADGKRIPFWLRIACDWPTQSHPIIDALHLAGLWDMNDGDYYVNGRWNWRCWEMWERFYARHQMETRWMPWFPRTMKRLFGGMRSSFVGTPGGHW